MIKIMLSYGFAKWEKGNKRYLCIRKFNGKKSIYDQKIYILYVWNTTTYNMKPRIRSDSLADINKRIKKTNIEIEEY